MAKGGELIAEFLIKEKVPYIFGICGHGNVGMLDCLYDVRSEISLISPRHEQVAAHMADGYFRVKHEAVATLTSISDETFTSLRCGSKGKPARSKTSKRATGVTAEAETNPDLSSTLYRDEPGRCKRRGSHDVNGNRVSSGATLTQARAPRPH